MLLSFSLSLSPRQLRARCTQLEKTVRWWSDCTTTWRDKWSCIRNERNLARDELKRTKAALAAAEREIGQLAGRCDELTRKISRLCSVGSFCLRQLVTTNAPGTGTNYINQFHYITANICEQKFVESGTLAQMSG
ncbi:unnamed protein product [Schistocephalus solidus]|uniref:Coiled-coil domain-containing protein 102A n=1 Tax=Schistocephalus solidus TaxID=70667 RepID=A0A3P7CXB4_SCHSO|nr:unnamed protein product [Schistocephalus solidus]